MRVFVILLALFVGLGLSQIDAIAQTTASQSSKPYSDPQIAQMLNWHQSNSNQCQGYYAEPDNVKDFPNPGDPTKELTHISAKGLSTLTEDGVSILRQDVVVDQPGRHVTADTAYIYRNQKTGEITKVILAGHVHLQEKGKLIVSKTATMTFYPHYLKLNNAVYHLYRDGSDDYGTAKIAIREPSQEIILHNATYSTCSPLHPSWNISATKITLDKANNIGHAYNGVVRFKHVPIFYWPYYSFPLHRQRKSGLLMPRLGYSNKSGSDTAWPIYWNMAPNYDMIVTPEYYSLRGSRISSYFRYLTKRASGYFYGSFLPDDKQFNSFVQQSINTYSNTSLYPASTFDPYLNALHRETNQRWFGSFFNFTKLDENWTTSTNLNFVSDSYFFQDLSLGENLGAGTLTNQLLNHFDMTYSGNHWQFSGLAQGYQTLHIIGQYMTPALDQYIRAPEFTAEAFYADVLPYTDFLFNTDLANFVIDNVVTPEEPFGDRYHLRPGLEWPIYLSGTSIKPQVWVDATAYNVYNNNQGLPNSSDRILPIIDIDNNVSMDNEFTFRDKKYHQTIQPRIMYLYVPYQNQNNLPNFDSFLLPFSYPQIFSLNQYTSYDRIQNANQLDFGLSEAVFNIDNAQLISTHLGMIYFFSQPAVCLSAGCQLPQRDVSPIYGDLTYNLFHEWALNTSLAWDPVEAKTDNANLNINYHRDAKSVVGLGYQFVREDNNSISTATVYNPNNAVFSTETSEINAGFSWPLSLKWSMVAFSDYNISLNRFDTYYGGLQYDSCCWSLTLITQRSYINSTANSDGSVDNNFDTGYFVTFTLKGLGDVGTADTANLLRSTIPGYGQY